MAIDTPARIAVIGAGPIGLEAALYGRYLGYDVDLYERGQACEHVRRWGHQKLQGPFGRCASPLGRAALKAQNESWVSPADNEVLTGREMVDAYWQPLAQSDLIVDGLYEQSEVVFIGRGGLLKGDLAGDETRGDGLFRLLVDHRPPGGQHREHIATADIVIDCSGVYGNPLPLGDGGIPAPGERAAAKHIDYGLPDIFGADRARFADRSVLVVGESLEAATAVVLLAELARQCSQTWITWVTRPARDADGDPITRDVAKMLSDSAAGPLSAEQQRFAHLAASLAADSQCVTYLPGSVVDSLTCHADLARFNVRLSGQHASEIEVDRIIGCTGHVPCLHLARELQVSTCPITGGHPQLGAFLKDWDGQSDLPACTPEVLLQPEPHFYVLGAKSWGRDPRSTMAAGLDQIRALFAIIGDRADLNLYSTMAGLA